MLPPEVWRVLYIVFGAAALAVLVAVAVLATGRGDGLAPLPDDVSTVDALPQGPLGSKDVDAVRLPVGFHGYRVQAVDRVLDRLSSELAERDARIADLEKGLVPAASLPVRPVPWMSREVDRPAPTPPTPEQADAWERWSHGSTRRVDDE